MSLKSLFYLLSCCIVIACSSNYEDNSSSGHESVYVSGYTDKRGRFHKGYVRKAVSTHPSAARNNMRSKYYYQTKGKYRRRK